MKDTIKSTEKKAHSTKKGKTNTGKRTVMKVVLGILTGILIILMGVALYLWNYTKPDPMSGKDPESGQIGEWEDEMETEEEYQEQENETEDPDAPTINQEAAQETLPQNPEEEITKDEGWTHYLLMGIDGTRHSDAMIVFSINKEDSRLVLSSVPRDTFVYVEGKGFSKLNGAYGVGGADLVVRTFRENFDIDIANYFMVDFESLPKIVDLVGGVTLTLTDKEAAHMGELYAAWGLSGGTQRLNGKEVLAYCRVRKIDSDYRRVERQYKALMAIYEEVKKLPVSEYPELAKIAYSYTYSDMTLGNMLLLMNDVLEVMKHTDPVNVKLVGGQNSHAQDFGKYGSIVIVDDLVDVASEWRESLGIEAYTPSQRLIQIGEQLDKTLGR